MFENIDTVDTILLRNDGRHRRRAAVRYRCHLANPAQLSGPGADRKLAWVYNLSVAGVGLLLDGPVAVGTEWGIDLFTAANTRVAVRGRVAHATQRPDATWLVGFAFSQPISTEELEALL
jgi:hypothetical protein